MAWEILLQLHLNVVWVKWLKMPISFCLQNTHSCSLNHKCDPKISKTLLLSLPFSLIAHNCCTFHLLVLIPCWLAGELHVVLSQPVQTHKMLLKYLKSEGYWRFKIICLWEPSNFSPNLGNLGDILRPFSAPPAWDSSSPCCAPHAAAAPRARLRGCPRGRGGREASQRGGSYGVKPGQITGDPHETWHDR